MNFISQIKQPSLNIFVGYFITISILSSFFSCDAREKERVLKYINPTEFEFPILAVNTFSKKEDITLKNFKVLRDAGFNISLALLQDTTLANMSIKYANDAGVKTIINCPEVKLHNKIPHIVPYYSNKPGIIGYYVTDEPTTSSFKKWKKQIDLILKYDSIHIPYINLLPIVNPKRLQAKDYESYLNEYLRVTGSPMLSFDHYPIRSNGEHIYISNNFYENLEIVSKVARNEQIPFWAFCLSAPHNNYPTPTKIHLMFEAFSALAYGAQGLSYYTYTIPRNSNYHSAPIDSSGKKTKIWYAVKDINSQIHNLSYIFLGADLVDVWHTGDSIPKGTKQLTTLPSPFRKIENSKKGVLISHLRNKGKNYLVIVNHDIDNKQTILLGNDKTVMRVFPDGSIIRHNGNSFKLDPGGYAIFTW